MSDDNLRDLTATPLRGEAADAMLRRLLQSLVDGADEPLAMGRALYSAADMVDEAEKRRLYAIIFDCLMQSLEEYAMLSLMFWDENRHPVDTWLGLEKPELRAFFARAIKGLGDELIFRLAGVAPLPQLKRIPAFKDKDFSSDESALDWAANDAREQLAHFGRLYHAGPEAPDALLGPWQLAYLKASLGRRLLSPSPDGASELLIATEQGDPATNAPGNIFSAVVSVDSHLVERILHELERSTDQVGRLAGRRLAMLDDPTAGVRAAKGEWMKHLESLRAAKLASGAEPTAADASHAAAVAEAPPAKLASPERGVAPVEGPKVDPSLASHSHADSHDVLHLGGLKIIRTQSIKKYDSEDKKD